MLQDLREKLDTIDDKIATLYNERMDVVKQVGMEKAKTDGSLFNAKREKDIINRVTKRTAPEISIYTKQIFEEIFETSRAYQRKFLNTKSVIADEIKKIILNGIKDFPKNATVACQGIEGSYSTIATEKMFDISDIVYFKTFDGVFNAVEKGMCKYGVLPIENSSVGSVNAVYDLMKKYNFHIARGLKLKVSHNLLCKKEGDISKIKEIYSHEQAIDQCKQFLSKIDGLKVTICSNTAVAAKMVSESDRDDIACISSKECSSIYGLKILEKNIQDSDSNYTRFICISKNLELFKNANKISIMVNLSHEPGSLNNLLKKFSTLGLNLTKLESRPLPATPFEFMFYFDFNADIFSNSVLELVAELESSCEQFTFLGNYYEET